MIKYEILIVAKKYRVLKTLLKRRERERVWYIKKLNIKETITYDQIISVKKDHLEITCKTNLTNVNQIETTKTYHLSYV